MSLKAWMIKAWPTIEWYLPPDDSQWPPLWHMSTEVHRYRAEGELCSGETVWLGSVDGQSIGVAWEWTELRPGVVLLADPNSIVSNVRFMDLAKNAESELHALISANRIANALPWQPPVRAVVQAYREHPEVGEFEVIDAVSMAFRTSNFASSAALSAA